MRVAVLTLTRDRLEYTRHCFQTLRANAGIDYDHFVLDQGSSDGTQEWLADQDHIESWTLDENVGICRGLNLLLDQAVDPGEYDVLVRFDNDCEVLQADTLRVVAEAALDNRMILAPRVMGLNHPPPTLATLARDPHLIDETAILGGIFMAVPAALFSVQGFRYDERHPAYTGDEAICHWWRQRGGRCGYLQGFAVNHYETTEGQKVRYPAYEARKLQEIAA